MLNLKDVVERLNKYLTFFLDSGAFKITRRSSRALSIQTLILLFFITISKAPPDLFACIKPALFVLRGSKLEARRMELR